MKLSAIFAAVIVVSSVSNAEAFEGAKTFYDKAKFEYKFDGIAANLSIVDIDASGQKPKGTVFLSNCRKGRSPVVSGTIGILKENGQIADRNGSATFTLEDHTQVELYAFGGNQTQSGFSFASNISIGDLEKLILAFYDHKMIIVSYEEGSMAAGWKSSDLVFQSDSSLSDDAKRALGGFLQTCKILDN